MAALDTIGGDVAAGSVVVWHGWPPEGSSGSGQFWHQDLPGIEGLAGPLDAFGAALATGDLNGDGFDELVIGVPLEDIGSIVDTGGVHVLYGGSSGLTTAGAQLFLLDDLGLGPVVADRRMGLALTAGPLGLAIDVPDQGVSGFAEAGVVAVLSGSAIFVDGFESGDFSAWSNVTP